MSDIIVIQRLLLVALIAGAIGFERERHGRAAGLRTHILVGIGACLVMLTGLYMTEAMPEIDTIDPTRMAAQVISGLGFLGAGTILRFRASVRGLTTAASLWAVGGIGIAVGSGFIIGAVAAGVVVIGSLFGFTRIERLMHRDWYRTLVIETRVTADEMASIRDILSEYQVEIKDFEIKKLEDSDCAQLKFHVKLLAERHQTEILQALLQKDAITRARWV